MHDTELEKNIQDACYFLNGKIHEELRNKLNESLYLNQEYYRKCLERYERSYKKLISENQQLIYDKLKINECYWINDTDEIYITSCGFSLGSIMDAKYCPYCGNKIIYQYIKDDF